MQRFSIKVGYDPALDWRGRASRRKPSSKPEDPAVRAIRVAKAHSDGEAPHAKRTAERKAAFVEADAQLAETVRCAVAAIEQALAAVNDAGPVAGLGLQVTCNYRVIHNAVVALKTKCGAIFEPPQADNPYFTRIALDHPNAVVGSVAGELPFNAAMLAATIVEQGDDLRRLRMQVSALCKQFRVEETAPPQGWIVLKEAAYRCGVTVESVRLWCLSASVIADRFQSRWFVDPDSLPKHHLERTTPAKS